MITQAQKIRGTALRIFPYIVMAVLATIIFFKMNSNKKLTIEVEAQKIQAVVYERNAKEYVKQADELKKEIPKLKESVLALQKANENKNIEIAVLKDRVDAKLSDIKRYNSNDIALYYQKRYRDKKGVVLTQYGVALTDTIAKHNISELTQFDGTAKELILVTEKLETTNKIVSQKDGIIENVETQNKSLNMAIAENDKALKSKDEVIKATEKGMKRERNKKNFWKLTTGTVLTFAGYILFTK